MLRIMSAIDKPRFFNIVRRSLFGGSLNQDQVDTLEAIIDCFNEYAPTQLDHDRRRLAYVLATPYHEVGRDLLPKSENLNYSKASRIAEVWPSRFRTAAAAKPFVGNPIDLANKVYGGRLGNDAPGDGWRYRGRGFSQITGKANYERFADLLGVDLVGNPDLAMTPKIAARILVMGMAHGLFTGKRLSDYIGPGKTDYVNARRIINSDVAANGKKIAGHAEKFAAAIHPAD